MRALGNVLTLTAVVLVAVAPPAWAQSPGPKFASMDVERAVVGAGAGVGAREQLERERGGMQQKRDAKRRGGDARRDELERRGPLRRGGAGRDKQAAFGRNRRDAARL